MIRFFVVTPRSELAANAHRGEAATREADSAERRLGRELVDELLDRSSGSDASVFIGVDATHESRAQCDLGRSMSRRAATASFRYLPKARASKHQVGDTGDISTVNIRFPGCSPRPTASIAEAAPSKGLICETEVIELIARAGRNPTEDDARAIRELHARGRADFEDCAWSRIRTWILIFGDVIESQGCARPSVPTCTQVSVIAEIERAEIIVPTFRSVIKDIPVPPRRDPLYVSGFAPLGSKVRIYNGSQPEHPLIEQVIAGPIPPDHPYRGKNPSQKGYFSIECTDATKFEYGCVLRVVVEEPGKKPSRTLMVPTKPLEDRTTYRATRQGGATLESSFTRELIELPENTDNKGPFLDPGKVTFEFMRPKDKIDVYRFQLTGQQAATESGASLRCRIEGEDQAVNADEDGRFQMTLANVRPSTSYTLEVTDCNGKCIYVPLTTPPMTLDRAELVRGTKSSQDERGNTILQICASGAAPSNGALVIRNDRSQVFSKLCANSDGDISGELLVLPGDILTVASRDARNIRSTFSERFLVLPTGGIMSLDDFSRDVPDVAKQLSMLEIECVKGKDVLPITLRGLPAFATLQLEREDGSLHPLRADGCGEIHEKVEVRVQERLAFSLLDAAGRLFPNRYTDYYPAHSAQSYPKERIASELCPLERMIVETGEGKLQVPALKMFAGRGDTIEVRAQHFLRTWFTSGMQSPHVRGPIDRKLLIDTFTRGPMDYDLGITLRTSRDGYKLSVSHIGGDNPSFLVNSRTGMLSIEASGSLSRKVTGSSADLELISNALTHCLAVAATAKKQQGDCDAFNVAVAGSKLLIVGLDKIAFLWPELRGSVAAAINKAVRSPFCELEDISPDTAYGSGRAYLPELSDFWRKACHSHPGDRYFAPEVDLIGEDDILPDLFS